MAPVLVKPSSDDRWPSWKIQTTAPKDAVSDSTFITTALTGSTTEPKARNSRTRVTPTTNRPIHGRVAPRLASRSRRSAARPPTRTSAPAGSGTSRTSPTRARASAGQALVAVPDLDQRGAAVGGGHLRGLDAGQGGHLVDVPAQGGPVTGVDRPVGERRHRVDRRRAAAREVGQQRLGHDPALGALGQRPVVDPAELHPQERQPGDEQQRHDHRDVGDRSAHDAAGQPVPRAVRRLGCRRGDRRTAVQERDPQRVDPRTEDGEQRRQHGQGADHRDEDGRHAAEAHRPEEHLREEQQRRQRDRPR